MWNQCEQVRPIEVVLVGNTLKAACEFGLEGIAEPRHLKVYVAHWPCPLYGASSDKRVRIAQRLRTVLEKSLGDNESVIVMGDFNEEPFGVLEEHLDAVRDLAAVRRFPKQMLFNPFWRELGHREFQLPACGTYRIDRPGKSSWSTFDQILLSNSLITGRGRLLNAGSMENVFGGKSMPSWSDHLPVFVELALSS